MGSFGQPFVEFREAFPDEESCARYLAGRRWPGGFICGCGSVRHWPLKGRAHTFECIDCRRHTSITSGTAMHGSHLLLRKWFYAAHLIATHSGSISARQLQTRLRVAYQTASELKRKLQIPEILADTEALKGCVEVAKKELRFKFYNRFLNCVMSSRGVVVITVELSNHGKASLQPIVARGFNRIRLAALMNASSDLIEQFIRQNVQSGATLLATDPYPFLELLGRGYELEELGETLIPAQYLLSALEDWLSARGVFATDQIDASLQGFVAETNWHVTFDNILHHALQQDPTSYWQSVGRENPRKASETVRRKPRHRKTALGMREDGSGTLVSFPPDIIPDF